MHTGKANLVLVDGRKLPCNFQFGSDFDETRAGYLLCDTSTVDPASLLDRLKIVCEDGTEIIAAVMHSSDRYVAVTGRVTRAAA